MRKQNAMLDEHAVSSRASVRRVAFHPDAAFLAADDPRLPSVGVFALFADALAGVRLDQAFVAIRAAHNQRCAQNPSDYSSAMDDACDSALRVGAAITPARVSGDLAVAPTPAGRMRRAELMTEQFLSLVDVGADAVYQWLSGVRGPAMFDPPDGPATDGPATDAPRDSAAGALLDEDVLLSRPAVRLVVEHPRSRAVSADDPRLPAAALGTLLGAVVRGASVAELFTIAAATHNRRCAQDLTAYELELNAACDIEAARGQAVTATRSPGVLASLSARATAVAGQFESLVDVTAHRVYGWLSGQQRGPLEDDLRALITQALTTPRAGAPSEEWVDALVRRTGAAGEDPWTLDAAARQVHVTRERVRQVQKTCTAWFAAHPLWVPQLEAVAALATQPTTAADLAAALVRDGLTRGPFTVAALRSVSELVGQPLSIDTVDGHVGVESADVKAIRKLARSLAGTPGAASVAQTAVMVADQVSVPGDELDSLVRQVVDADAWLRWCDPDRTVYRAQDASDRVRLRNVVAKMLAVSPEGRLTVRDLFDGYARKAPFRRDADGRVRSASLEVVTAFVHDHPEFIVDGDVVRAAHPVPYRGLIGDSVATMVDILREADGYVLDRGTLLQEAQRRGVNATTAGLWLTFNEVLANYGWAAWGLVGANPSPARIAALQESARSQFEKADVADGWDELGRPWFSVKVNRSFLSSGVLSMSWHPHLADHRFEAFLSDGSPAGRITFSAEHNFVWGWLPSLRLLEVNRGQRLRAAFDLTTSTVVVSVDH